MPLDPLLQEARIRLDSARAVTILTGAGVSADSGVPTFRDADGLWTEVDALIGPGAAEGIDCEAIETAVRRQAMRVAARAVERRLKADTTDHAGPTVPCVCGQAAA